MELSRVVLVQPCVVHTAALWERQPHIQHTQKLMCTFSAPLTDKDTHTHTKTASNTCRTTEKERGGGSGARKGKEREKGQREKECKIKRLKKRASQTKEKSVTHRE